MTIIWYFLKRHSVLAYFALTFALSWGGILSVVGPGGIAGNPEQIEAQLPFVYLAMLAGPSVAGILLTCLVYGRKGLRDLLSRFLTWRVGAGWYAASLLIAPLVATAVLLVLSLFSPAFFLGLSTSGDGPALLLSGITVGLVVGFFEELGWTGFAVPKMRLRYGPVTTGLIVGVVWGAWHLLVNLESDSFYSVVPLALLLARLFSWLPPYRVLMVWVHDRTDSLLVVMLMHASLVTTLFVLVPQSLEGISLLTWILAWAVALWIVVAVSAALSGRLLGHNQTFACKDRTL